MVHKVREALALLRRDGWVLVAQEGSHRQFRHPVKPGKVTISGKPSRDIPPEIWNSILKQAGLK
jgi:predicted RNA binding protein YcfA (HicA-like mRNA interferase family)